MGCTSSKRIEVAVDVYRPAPSSFSVFDIHAIEEPWLKSADAADDLHDEKTSHMPPPILEKLKAIEDAPRSWDEVSKALEDLKPKLNAVPALPAPDSNPKQASATQSAKDSPAGKPKTPEKSFSFHTLEELEAKISSNPPRKSGSTRQQNRIRARKGRKAAGFVKRDPLSDFEEICPPGGDDKVVVYTTSLGGVRRTYEDCNRVRQLLETHQVVFDERDVALDGGFLSELRELVGEGAACQGCS
ncbi:UNVERIFIED_CONTAM: hypothetical protein Sangu_3061600 [Sesamum angustifolium]|uniref:Glutaredoxin domain-containing protein n=1 Tax=Sesamum angustifolium TaxID=2727405 RepID=A0AAW2KEL9_9LAMI